MTSCNRFVLLAFASITSIVFADACAGGNSDACNSDADCAVEERCVEGLCRLVIGGEGEGFNDDEPVVMRTAPIDGTVEVLFVIVQAFQPPLTEPAPVALTDVRVTAPCL